MQNPTRFDKLSFNDEFYIAPARSGGHNIFVKWKRYENNYREKIDYSAYSSHSLRTMIKQLARWEGPKKILPIYVHFGFFKF